MSDEGYAPGSPPTPATVRSPRCRHCGLKLAEYLTPPFSIRCRKCKAQNVSGDPPPPVGEVRSK